MKTSERKPSRDWNTLDVDKLKLNDQAEITRLYNLTRPYFLWFLKNREELFHDVVVAILKRLPEFDPEKGKFHVFCFLVARHCRWSANRAEQRRKEREAQTMRLNAEHIEVEDVAEGWTCTELTEFEEILGELPEADRVFVEEYRKEFPEVETRRKRFARIKKNVVKIKHHRDQRGTKE